MDGAVLLMTMTGLACMMMMLYDYAPIYTMDGMMTQTMCS